MNEKIKKILKKEQEMQHNERPLITYCRHQIWDKEPCDFCGSVEKPSKVKGRYIAGSLEDKNLIFTCGNCLDSELEVLFEAMYD